MISIAMTTYNGEKYLREQIDSILGQDYTNFELIICDDCSVDSTKDILHEYSIKDKRIHVHFNSKNLGFKENFVQSIQLCNGDFIALSDQDDVWDRSHLTKLVSKIGNNYLVCGDALCFEVKNGVKNNKYLLSELEQNLDIIKDSTSNIKRILFKGNPYQGSSMLFSKEFKKIALPIPVAIPFHDVWFALVASCYTSFVYTNEVVNNYRQHEESVTKRSKNSLFTSISKMPNYSANLRDRCIYSRHLKMLIDNDNTINEEIREFLVTSTAFFSRIDNRCNRIMFYPYYRKNIFYYLYGGTSLMNRLARKLQFLFF